MNWKPLALVAVALVQLGVPAHLIGRQQRALAEGTEYRFRTAPVDPADPFRGRYVRLDFAAACADTGERSPVYRREQRKWFAAIEHGPDGFARIVRVTTVRPTQGDYLQVRSGGWGWGCEKGMERMTLPFDRYYLPEEMAPQAEAAYFASNRRIEAAAALPPAADGTPADHRVPAYASVRVLDGHAALVDLYLDGLPLREFLKREDSQKGG